MIFLVILYLLGISFALNYVTPIYGNIHTLAYYYIYLDVGTPPQRQSVILDTGSTLLGFPCEACKNECGIHMNPKFNHESSHSSKQLKCNDNECKNTNYICDFRGSLCKYSQMYTEGSSINGFYISDYISLASNKDNEQNPRYKFDYIGCHTEETVLFRTQSANGIMGISFPRNGVQPTIIDVLLEDKSIDNKIFTICLADEGGTLQIGNYNNDIISVNNVKIAYTKFVSNTVYHVKLKKISNEIEEDYLEELNVLYRADSFPTLQIDTSSSVALIDSGTTYTYFPAKIYENLTKLFDIYCDWANKLGDDKFVNCIKDEYDYLCFDFNKYVNNTHSDIILLNQLPPILFVFDVEDDSENGEIYWEAKSYLYKSKTNYWCTAIDTQYRNQIVLGQSFMKNKQAIFDRINHKLGLVNSNCSNIDNLIIDQNINSDKAKYKISGSIFGFSQDDLNNTESMLSQSVFNNPNKNSINKYYPIVSAGLFCGIIITIVRRRTQYTAMTNEDPISSS